MPLGERGRAGGREVPIVRVLFTAQAGAGHRRPLAPRARALVAAGHAVAFATTPFGYSDSNQQSAPSRR